MNQAFVTHWISHVNRLLAGEESPRDLLPQRARMIDMGSGFEYPDRDDIAHFLSGLRNLGIHRLHLATAHVTPPTTVIEVVWEACWTHQRLRHGNAPRRTRTSAIMVFDFSEAEAPLLRFFWNPEVLLQQAADIDRVPLGYGKDRRPRYQARRPRHDRRYAAILGAAGCLTAPLAEALHARGERVRVLDSVPVPERFVRLYGRVRDRATIYVLLHRGSLASRFDNPAALQLSMRTTAAAIAASGVRRVCIVTDFSLGEALDPRWQLSMLESWDETELFRHARRIGGETGLLALAYGCLRHELHAAGLSPARAHAGLVLGDARTGAFERNPQLVGLLQAVGQGHIHARPSSPFEWLPAISADFAAAAIAALPHHDDLAAEALWLFDPRTPNLDELLCELSLRLSRRPAGLKIANWLIEEFAWLGLPSALGVAPYLYQIQRRRCPNERLRTLARRAGLRWPDLRLALARTVDYHLLCEAKPRCSLPVRGRRGGVEQRRPAQAPDDLLVTF